MDNVCLLEPNNGTGTGTMANKREYEVLRLIAARVKCTAIAAVCAVEPSTVSRCMNGETQALQIIAEAIHQAGYKLVPIGPVGVELLDAYDRVLLSQLQRRMDGK